jgi:hypothetical protein
MKNIKKKKKKEREELTYKYLTNCWMPWMTFSSCDVSTATTDTLASFSGGDSMSTRHSLEALSVWYMADTFRISSGVVCVVSCRVTRRVVGRVVGRVSHLLRIGAANVDLGSVHGVDTLAHLHTLSVGQSLGVEELCEAVHHVVRHHLVASGEGESH